MNPPHHCIANRSATAFLLSIATFHSSWITGTILASIGVATWVMDAIMEGRQSSAIALRKDELRSRKLRVENLTDKGMPLWQAEKMVDDASKSMWKNLKTKPPVIE